MKSIEQFMRLFCSMTSQENESILSVISSVSVVSDVFCNSNYNWKKLQIRKK